METFWGFAWYWCLIPLGFIAFFALACLLMRRAGACGCMRAAACNRSAPPTPGTAEGGGG